jgi:hypothetical protein
MSTPTPRTDALARKDHISDGLWISHSRLLERENATLTAERDQLRAEFEKIAVIAAQTQDRNVSLKIERDQLRAELATERARLDYVLKTTGWYFGNRSEIDGYIKVGTK